MKSFIYCEITTTRLHVAKLSFSKKHSTLHNTQSYSLSLYEIQEGTLFNKDTLYNYVHSYSSSCHNASLIISAPYLIQLNDALKNHALLQLLLIFNKKPFSVDSIISCSLLSNKYSYATVIAHRFTNYLPPAKIFFAQWAYATTLSIASIFCLLFFVEHNLRKQGAEYSHLSERLKNDRTDLERQIEQYLPTSKVSTQALEYVHAWAARPQQWMKRLDSLLYTLQAITPPHCRLCSCTLIKEKSPFSIIELSGEGKNGRIIQELMRKCDALNPSIVFSTFQLTPPTEALNAFSFKAQGKIDPMTLP